MSFKLWQKPGENLSVMNNYDKNRAGIIFDDFT